LLLQKLFINYKILSENIFRGFQAVVLSMKKLGKAAFDPENTFRKLSLTSRFRSQVDPEENQAFTQDSVL
jgi:hypothetical protein